MKMNKLLVVLGLLTSASAMAAGTVDSSVFGGSAQQSVDVTFQAPLMVNHTLKANKSQFRAGKTSDQVELATGEVKVTAGALREGQSLAITPTTLSKKSENSGPKWVNGQATGEGNSTFDFTLGNRENLPANPNFSVKNVGGKKWLTGSGDKLSYSIWVMSGENIKPGKYNISVDAAVYAE